MDRFKSVIKRGMADLQDSSNGPGAYTHRNKKELNCNCSCPALLLSSRILVFYCQKQHSALIEVDLTVNKQMHTAYERYTGRTNCNFGLLRHRTLFFNSPTRIIFTLHCCVVCNVCTITHAVATLTVHDSNRIVSRHIVCSWLYVCRGRQ